MLLFERVKGWFIGIGVITVVVIVLYYLYWDAPEQWNPTAGKYYAHVGALKNDSVRSYKTIVRLKSDSTILVRNQQKLKAELDSAIIFGSEWKDRYKSQVMASDAFVDRIKENERDLALYKSLQKNGTLSKTVTYPTILPIQVTTASLKTAKRLEDADSLNNNLSKAFGVSQAAVTRLGRGLKSYERGTTTISKSIRDNAPKAVLFVNRKARNKAFNEARRLDSLKNAVSEETDLLKELNKYNQ